MASFARHLTHFCPQCRQFQAFLSIHFLLSVNPNVVTFAEKARLFKEKDDDNHLFERSFEGFDREKQINDLSRTGDKRYDSRQLQGSVLQKHE